MPEYLNERATGGAVAPPSFERRGPWGMLEPPLLMRGGEGSQKKVRQVRKRQVRKRRVRKRGNIKPGKGNVKQRKKRMGVRT
jgi:hypothetical protein